MEVLWDLPRIVIDGAEEYSVFREALQNCFIKAGDSDYIPGESTIYMFNTWSSTKQVRLMLCVLPEFVEKPLHKKTKSRHEVRTAFLRLLAVTQILEEYNHWFWDQEGPEEVNSLMQDFNRLWKRVLQHSDAELGLCGERARQHLTDFLRRFGTAVLHAGEEMDEEPDLYEFPWSWK